MKALTLYQPYAAAIALDLKHFETRGWKTSYRGALAIHAAQSFPDAAKLFAQIECGLGRIPKRLPIGAVVCVVDLVDVRPAHEVSLVVNAIERMYGDYAPGRWAWKLDNVRVLAEPLFMKGKQGLWNLPIPIESLQFGAV